MLLCCSMLRDCMVNTINLQLYCFWVFINSSISQCSQMRASSLSAPQTRQNHNHTCAVVACVHVTVCMCAPLERSQPARAGHLRNLCVRTHAHLHPERSIDRQCSPRSPPWTPASLPVQRSQRASLKSLVSLAGLGVAPSCARHIRRHKRIAVNLCVFELQSSADVI